MPARSLPCRQEPWQGQGQQKKEQAQSLPRRHPLPRQQQQQRHLQRLLLRPPLASPLAWLPCPWARLRQGQLAVSLRSQGRRSHYSHPQGLRLPPQQAAQMLQRERPQPTPALVGQLLPPQGEPRAQGQPQPRACRCSSWLQALPRCRRRRPRGPRQHRKRRRGQHSGQQRLLGRLRPRMTRTRRGLCSGPLPPPPQQQGQRRQPRVRARRWAMGARVQRWQWTRQLRGLCRQAQGSGRPALRAQRPAARGWRLQAPWPPSRRRQRRRRGQPHQRRQQHQQQQQE
jgi:hypothetical protein